MLTEFPDDWSRSKRTKYKIVKPAFEKFEGAKAILRIQWLKAKEAHQCELERGQYLDTFKSIADQHRRDEALKLAHEAEVKRAMSLFGSVTAPAGLRVN